MEKFGFGFSLRLTRDLAPPTLVPKEAASPLLRRVVTVGCLEPEEIYIGDEGISR